MGFTHDPGPLPFVTIRDRDKWAPRLAGHEIVEMQADRPGLTIPARAKVVKVEDYTGELPMHLAGIYRGRKLIAVHLEALDGR